jgi:hypothetical protein
VLGVVVEVGMGNAEHDVTGYFIIPHQVTQTLQRTLTAHHLDPQRSLIFYYIRNVHHVMSPCCPFL